MAREESRLMPWLTRRRLLVIALGTSSLSVGMISCRAAPVRGGMRNASVALPDFRAKGDRDDTAALHRALATGKPVHIPAGRGSGPQGRYLISNEATANLPSGAMIFGDGMQKTIVTRSLIGGGPFILHCDSHSADPANNISGLRFSDITFEDDVERYGFAQFSYLVMLNGVTDVRFDRVEFRGFRGDGLHLGSSVNAKTERHNRAITVENCVFDGVNSNNRNAISVIDAQDLTIQRSRFSNVTRRGDGTVTAGDPMNPATGLSQPGAIDMEPNGDAFAIIRDVVIRENHFNRRGRFCRVDVADIQ